MPPNVTTAAEGFARLDVLLALMLTDVTDLDSTLRLIRVRALVDEARRPMSSRYGHRAEQAATAMARLVAIESLPATPHALTVALGAWSLGSKAQALRRCSRRPVR